MPSMVNFLLQSIYFIESKLHGGIASPQNITKKTFNHFPSQMYLSIRITFNPYALSADTCFLNELQNIRRTHTNLPLSTPHFQHYIIVSIQTSWNIFDKTFLLFVTQKLSSCATLWHFIYVAINSFPTCLVV